MIDIIIPAYNAHDTIGRTLLSICKQLNKDSLKVYIINDGSDQNYSNIIDIYKNLLDIVEIDIENSGPGVARQIGLNNSYNEYIVFVDADDTLYNEYSLLNLLNIIQDADLAQGSFVEKFETDSKVLEAQYCYLHGKMYRRSIIEKYDIHFDECFRKDGDIYEDSSFNQLYQLCCEKIATTNEIIYTYEYNLQSITRLNQSDSKHLKNFIQAMNWLVDEIEKRDIHDKHAIAWHLFMILFHCYFKYLISEEESYFVFEDMAKLKKMYLKYIDNLSYEEQLQLYGNFNYQIIPKISFYDFLDKIK